jgi:hypothetical protein
LKYKNLNSLEKERLTDLRNEMHRLLHELENKAKENREILFGPEKRVEGFDLSASRPLDNSRFGVMDKDGKVNLLYFDQGRDLKLLAEAFLEVSIKWNAVVQTLIERKERGEE